MAKRENRLTIAEAAERLGTTPLTVRYLIDTKQIPALVKRNQKRTTYIIVRSVFEDWLSGRN